MNNNKIQIDSTPCSVCELFASKIGIKLGRKSFRMAPSLFHSIWNNNIVSNLPQWVKKWWHHGKLSKIKGDRWKQSNNIYRLYIIMPMIMMTITMIKASTPPTMPPIGDELVASTVASTVATENKTGLQLWQNIKPKRSGLEEFGYFLSDTKHNAMNWR